MPVTDTDLGYDDLVNVLEDLVAQNGVAVIVGFVATEVDDDILVRAAANEFGTATIPERSFMRSTVEENRDEYEDLLTGAATAMVTEGPAAGEQMLDLIGLRVKADIQKKIVDIRDPPNAPSTLARKAPKTNPLIDSGRMRQSVSYGIDTGLDL